MVTEPNMLLSVARHQLAKKRPAEMLRASRLLIFLISFLIFTSFLTETKFIPGIANNIGAFEVSAAIFFVAVALYFYKASLPLTVHPVIAILGLIVCTAGFSLLKVTANLTIPAISYAILIFSFFLVVIFFNVLLLDERYLVSFLRAFVYSAAIANAWVLLDGITSGGGVSASGPYRNRAHAGVISLTSFWILMVFVFWPRVKGLERTLLYFLIPFVLYGLAISGRRSVYIAFTVGCTGLVLTSLLAYGKGKGKILGVVVAVLFTFGLLYFVMSDYFHPAAFFKDRVHLVQDRIEMVLQSDDPTVDDEDNFIASQRRSVARAFADNPLLGIGWGAFFESEYDATGHEVHSTPMRFLAETGIVGFALYLFFMGRLIFGSFRLWLSARKTSYQMSALVTCMAFLSLSVSYFHNRQMTERTFWMFLIFYLGFEEALRRKIKRSNNRLNMLRRLRLQSADARVSLLAPSPEAAAGR
jgi:O-antigen ligase